MNTGLKMRKYIENFMDAKIAGDVQAIHYWAMRASRLIDYANSAENKDEIFAQANIKARSLKAAFNKKVREHFAQQGQFKKLTAKYAYIGDKKIERPTFDIAGMLFCGYAVRGVFA